MEITYRQLVELNACYLERSLFLQTFGSSLTIPTEREAQNTLIEILIEKGFDFYWVSENILNGEQEQLFTKIRTPALINYRAIENSAFAKYTEAHNEIDSQMADKQISRAEGRILINQVSNTYSEIQTKASKEYYRICWDTVIQILTGKVE